MVGTTVLHYEVLRELGAGGMGQVYLARDRRTERLVALKFLRAEADGDPDSRQRLVREARAAARLAHPGVVTLFGLEESEGRSFLVQEYVEGETLAARLVRGPLGSHEAQRLARELTAALAHAHKQGILHRDLKPANILVAPDGSFKIADFGIAHVEGSLALTRTGAVMGTLGYLAPERLRGHVGDARADLFALGTILHEAISGRRAFAGASEAEVLHAVLEDDPPPLATPSSLAPLAEVVRRLIAKSPQDRPASAEEVAGLLAGTAAQAHPGPTLRPRVLLALAGGALIAAAIAGIALLRPGGTRTLAGAPPAIAILYFENVPDPDDGARMGSISSNLLVTSFAQNDGLNVLGTQRMLEAMRDVGARGAVDRAAAMRIARRAHAQRIVTGSILRVEPAIVLTAEVADVATGRVIHAERVEGQPGQTIFDVVDILSSRLASKLARSGEPGTASPAPVARVTSADLEAQAAYAEGLEHFAAGELNAASTAFGRALGRDPAFPQALYHRAIVQWWLEEASGAEASVLAARAQAARLTPGERVILEGVSLLIARRWSDARKVFERIAREAPDEKLAYYGIMEGAWHGGENAMAVTAARRALSIDPGFDLVSIHMVDALQALGRPAEADRVAVESLKRHSGNEILWLTLFQLRVARGDGPGALAAARSAHEAKADSADVSFLAILLALNLGRLEEAAVWIRPEKAAEELVPYDGQRTLAYGQALRRGRFREAVGIAEQAWRAFPPDIRLPFPAIPGAEGSEATFERGDFRRALAWTDSTNARFVRWRGPDGANHAELAKLAMRVRVGRVREAEAGLQRLSARTLAPHDRQRVRYVRALLHERGGEFERALEQLGGSVPTGWPPMSGGVRRLTRGRLELALGRPAAALATFDTLLLAPLIEPHEAVRLRLHRGRALERLGRMREALASYREFLELWKDADPGRPEVAEARAAVARLARSPDARRRPTLRGTADRADVFGRQAPPEAQRSRSPVAGRPS